MLITFVYIATTAIILITFIAIMTSAAKSPHPWNPCSSQQARPPTKIILPCAVSAQSKPSSG